jgi:hypothetical protein
VLREMEICYRCNSLCPPSPPPPLHLSLSLTPSNPLSGQYSETCDGSSSTLTVNTSDITLGPELIEVMVYRKRERRKYSPLATDKTVFFVTGESPVYTLYTCLLPKHQWDGSQSTTFLPPIYYRFFPLYIL